MRGAGPSAILRPVTPLSILLWALALVLVLAGLVGTVRPTLPGAPLILAGIALAASIDHFTKISWWTVGAAALLAVLSFFADSLTTAAGARRVNASPMAVTGATIGSFLGIFGGPIGVIVLPLVGTVVGDYIAQRDLRRATKVGIATWFASIAATAMRIALAFAMVGLFVVALLF